MPLQPGGISQDKRRQALREILRKHGSLSKKEIDSYVCAFLSCEETALSRSLYRDLEEFVNQGEAEVSYIHKGQPVSSSDYDPETHKSVIARWRLVSRSDDFLDPHLQRAHCSLIADESLKSCISIHPALVAPSDAGNSIFFSAMTWSFCLKIEPTEYPFTLLLARTPKSLRPSVLRHSLEQTNYPNALYLLVPVDTVSGFNNAERPGHAAFEFLNPKTVNIFDFKSKHGTIVSPLTQQQLKPLEQQSNRSQDYTASETAHATARLLPIAARKRMPVNSKITKVRIPILTEISNKLDVIVC